MEWLSREWVDYQFRYSKLSGEALILRAMGVRNLMMASESVDSEAKALVNEVLAREMSFQTMDDFREDPNYLP